MSLFDKIKTIYPSLTDVDFHPAFGTIVLQNDSDGKGDYIQKWSHPTLSKPSDSELNS
jgi:hypothetical protein